MARLWQNDAYSTLASGLAISDTTMVVATGEGDRFPVVAAPNTANVTLKNAAGQVEIVTITARTSGSDSMTITRAQESTAAAIWLTGDVVSLRPTAAAFTGYETHKTTTTGVHGVTGNVVGDTDVQTLTNKTLTQPTLTLKQGTGLNTLGELQVDPTSKFVHVGDGAAIHDLVDADSAQTVTNKSLQALLMEVYYATDFLNSAYGALNALAGEIQLIASKTGTGTYLPLTFNVNAAERLRFDVNGEIGIAGANYGTAGQVVVSGGSGAAVSWQNVGASSKQTIWVPAGAMLQRTTSPPALGSVEGSSNNTMMVTYNFDTATSEYVQFTVRMPKGWDISTVTAYFLWSNATAASGNVVWAIQAKGISDGDAIDSVFGTTVSVTDSVIAAGDLMQSAETSAMTIGGTPTSGDLVVFQVYRDAPNANDTLTEDARLHGVVLVYGVTGLNDA